MLIKRMRMENVRCFKKTPILNFRNINIFIGQNNYGKSTILKAIYGIQKEYYLTKYDISKIVDSKASSFIKLEIDCLPYYKNTTGSDFDRININLHSTSTYLTSSKSKTRGTIGLDYNKISTEPHNLIYPCFSSRHLNENNNVINELNVNSINEDNSNLHAKIDRLINPDNQPQSSIFRNFCKSVFGFTITTDVFRDGKQAIRFVKGKENIPISSMGDGIKSVLKIVTEICVAREKIILIEEPENDLHPLALKELLALIAESSKYNQFFITTHSNIVLRQLGALKETSIFHITKDNPDDIFSIIKEIPPSDTKQRIEILNNLGYDFSDFNLWSGWLFLEESSAEILIRDYFIKWYCDKLVNKLRTFSSKGMDSIDKKFDIYNDLFVFIHLEPLYKNRAWVVIDGGGETEQRIISKFKSKYCMRGWKENHFKNLNQHDFERYYPEIFKDQVYDALNEKDKKKKKNKKETLLQAVINWINTDEKTAIKDFSESAKEVIDILKEIEMELCQ